MNTSFTDDIRDIESPNAAVYSKAFESLVSSGSSAMPALVAFLADAQRQNRALAAAAISTIADKSYADAIARHTDDDDSRVRAWSAVALRRMNDPRALNALLKTIDDYPDEAHSDQTLVTYALIQWGEAVLLPVTDLLNASRRETRMHAFDVLKKIVFNKLGTKEAWEQAWKENGTYDPDAGETIREAAVEKWKRWITGSADNQ